MISCPSFSWQKLSLVLCLSLPFCLQVNQASAKAIPPTNDNFANAQPISDVSVSLKGSLGGATTEPFEPRTGRRSVWYSLRVSTMKKLAIYTCDSRFHSSKYRIYQADSIDQLNIPIDETKTILRGSLNSCSDAKTALLETGKQYYLRVFDSQATQRRKDFAFQLSFANPPGNDMFAAAENLPYGQTTAQQLTFATNEENEGSCNRLYDGEKPSVWYRFTAKQTGLIRLNTVGEQHHNFMLYRLAGDNPQNFTSTQCVDPESSFPATTFFTPYASQRFAEIQNKVRDFSVKAGVPYAIRVAQRGSLFITKSQSIQPQSVRLRIADGSPRNLGLRVKFPSELSRKYVLDNGFPLQLRCNMTCTVQQKVQIKLRKRWITLGQKIYSARMQTEQYARKRVTIFFDSSRLKATFRKYKTAKIRIYTQTGFYNPTQKEDPLYERFFQRSTARPVTQQIQFR